MKRLIIGIVAAASLVGVAPAFAQSVNPREATQQQRIDQGVRSGSLTAQETYHIERREGRIDTREARMRARDNGHLTHHDRRVLKRALNRTSRRIHQLKHNGRHYRHYHHRRHRY
jgi:hypothetical protein